MQGYNNYFIISLTVFYSQMLESSDFYLIYFEILKNTTKFAP